MVCVPLPHWSKQQKGYAHLVSTIAKAGVALAGSMSALDINSVIACSRLVRISTLLAAIDAMISRMQLQTFSWHLTHKKSNSGDYVSIIFLHFYEMFEN